MNKDELLKFCRYYKGEKTQPYTGGTLKGIIWLLESWWVADTLETNEAGEIVDRAAETLGRYINDGLGSFEDTDDVPVSLKAYMYAVHLKDNELPQIEDFKKFYYLWRDKKISR